MAWSLDQELFSFSSRPQCLLDSKIQSFQIWLKFQHEVSLQKMSKILR